jgi:hypothetical protein
VHKYGMNTTSMNNFWLDRKLQRTVEEAFAGEPLSDEAKWLIARLEEQHGSYWQWLGTHRDMGQWLARDTSNDHR